jgi:hypothetical protein
MPRDALFDAAVNRALEYAHRLGTPLDERGALQRGLELWYLKTRFAYRIPLEAVVNALQRYPKAESAYVWRGGKDGNWVRKAE